LQRFARVVRPTECSSAFGVALAGHIDRMALDLLSEA
jgi:hypothetical protein